MELSSSHSSYYINTRNKKISIYCVLSITLEEYAPTVLVGTNRANARNHELCLLTTRRNLELSQSSHLSSVRCHFYQIANLGGWF